MPAVCHTDGMTATTRASASLDRSGTTTPLAQFAAHVFRDPLVQARLGEHVMPDAFVDAALGEARAAGIVLGADALYPGTAQAAVPRRFDRRPGTGWFPARSVADARALAFDWAWFGETAPDDPFYEDTARRALSRPFNRLFRMRTTLDAVVADAALTDVPEPAGFVFHMSRCGSTLLARILRAVPGHTALSEPEPIDAVLRWARGRPQAERVAALRAIVAALGRDRSGDGRRLFIKLDSWHTLDLPLIRAAFPDVPWLFLCREPVEVMMSHVAQPGMHVVRGLLGDDRLGLDAAALAPLDYAAAALARICSAVVEHIAVGGGLLVDYAELVEAAQDAIPRHFGFALDPTERAAVAAAATRDAKAPDSAFAPDALRKRAASSDAVRAAAATYIGPVYAQLDDLRAARWQRANTCCA